eukprot:2013232-Rhodomonas_salina.2
MEANRREGVASTAVADGPIYGYPSVYRPSLPTSPLSFFRVPPSLCSFFLAPTWIHKAFLGINQQRTATAHAGTTYKVVLASGTDMYPQSGTGMVLRYHSLVPT